MIFRLLILVTVCCGLSLAMMARQRLPLDSLHLTPSPDTTHPILPPAADTTRPVSDSTYTAPPRADTTHPVSDSAHPVTPPTDSILRSPFDTTRSAPAVPFSDSSRHQPDTTHKTPTDTTLGGQLARQLDSLQKQQGVQKNVRTVNSGSFSPGGFPASGGGGAPARSLPPPITRRGASSRPQLSNLHRKYIPVRKGPIRIDSLSVVPNAFFLKDIEDSAYTLDWINGTLTWKTPPPQDSVLATYRLFPYKLNAVSRRFNYDSIQNYFLVQPYSGSTAYGQGGDDFFNFGNITYNGSFGRAISFGNNQDAVVTSNLNLQISGYLADSIQITAAITDNNIPIQPDGTTADLNEFDKIYLQFKKKGWALTMGDIDLRQNQDYFMNFYKRLQGAAFETTNEVSKNFVNKAIASAAIAKGKFTRNIFQGQESNQGPYKLQDDNNDLYFVILAGSEKVYVDGILMQRGGDQDYTINYNTAEITFTANRMITQDSRIQVEFEYADRNYLNVNLYLSDEATINDKLKLHIRLFSNSDARNSPINQSLTSDQIKFLSGLGDSIDRAYYPVATVDTFATGKILYQKIDTTYKNAAGVLVSDSIYEFSVNSAVTLYNLSFVNVGQGYGDYVLSNDAVNGNVYQWVAPVNGMHQGLYEAAQFLVTPKTQQVMTAGADYAIDKNTTVSGEVAKSHYDINTLSNLDKSNDDGYAARFQFKNLHPIGAASKGLQLSSTLGYEYVQGTFTPLERLRSVEFLRDWGLSLTVNPADEKIYTAAFQLTDKRLNGVRYEFGRYERGDGFTGTRNSITHSMEVQGWRLTDKLSYTSTDSTNFNGYYLKPSVDLSKKLSIPLLKNYIIGGGWFMERNEDRDKKADTMTATSFSFQTFQAYLKSPEKNPNHWGLNVATRTNSYPDGRSMAEGDRSQTINFTADFTKNTHHQFHITATYRELKVLDTTLSKETADNTLLGRLEYVVNEWKGLLKGNVLYEVGSGQEQEKSYTYLQVPAGTGQYAWIDYNKDGIQQLTEFVLAQFPDQAQYIRVYTPTDQYIKANYNTLNYSFTIMPKVLVTPKSRRLIKFLGRMMLQSAMQLTEKEQAHGVVKLNPFVAPLDDTSLITRTMIMVNTFSFNRSDPHWGFDISNTLNGGKTLLTYGYETRQLNEWALKTRINLNKSIAFNATVKQGTNQLSNSSSNFDSSNYDLQQLSVEPNITYTHGSNFRVGMGYKMAYKQNSPALGDQKYVSGALNTDLKYNILQSTSIQAKFTVNGISYTAAGAAASTTSAVSYTILEGLTPGKNYLWGIDFTKKLGSSLEISLQYEGRQSPGTTVVNTGRASLRAIL